MPDPNERDGKLIQYLSEAFGKERELETALQVDIAITTKAPYKKRLQQHHLRKLEWFRHSLSGIKKTLTHIATHQFHALEIKTN